VHLGIMPNGTGRGGLVSRDAAGRRRSLLGMDSGPAIGKPPESLCVLTPPVITESIHAHRVSMQSRRVTPGQKRRPAGTALSQLDGLY